MPGVSRMDRFEDGWKAGGGSGRCGGAAACIAPAATRRRIGITIAQPEHVTHLKGCAHVEYSCPAGCSALAAPLGADVFGGTAAGRRRRARRARGCPERWPAAADRP